MGSYIYKVTPNRVTLSDGREANVAVYAYKPGFYPGCSGVHERSGAARADANAAMGRYTGLVVEGRKVEGSRRIDVVIDGPVFEYDKGSYNDDWMADCGKRVEGATIAGASYPCRLIRYRDIPDGTEVRHGLRFDRFKVVEEHSIRNRWELYKVSYSFRGGQPVEA